MLPLAMADWDLDEGLDEFTDEDWAAVMDTNINGVFRMCRAAGKIMLAQGSGKIINIGSYSAEKANNDWSHYITAKSALIAENIPGNFFMASTSISKKNSP